MARWFWMDAFGNKTVHKILRRGRQACNYASPRGRGMTWQSDESLLAYLADRQELTVCERCADYKPPTPEQIAAARAEWDAISAAHSRSVHAIGTAFESNRRRH